jgi:DeoR/GlpR family transcriptional regulator of sugar metabolism
LAEELGVTLITVRRDLERLEGMGKLMRVHGGAVPRDRMAYEATFKEKMSRNQGLKDAIGRAAAALVEPGCAVFLDTGTTTLAIARALREVKPATIVTVNLRVALDFVGEENIRVIMPGGQVGFRNPDLTGELALRTLSELMVDVAFLGCDGVDEEFGFWASTYESVAITQLMLKRSRMSYYVTDSSKFGRRSMWLLETLRMAHAGVITDDGIPPQMRATLEKMGWHVIVVPVARREEEPQTTTTAATAGTTDGHR